MERELAAYRRRLVWLLIILGSAATIGLWTFELHAGLISDYDRRGYPFLLAMFGTSLAILALRPRWQRTAEWTAYLGFALYCIMAVLHFDTLDPATRIYTIANTLQWMPLLYITAFIFFRRWEAIAAAAVIFALTIAALVYMLASGTDAWDKIYGSLIVNAYAVHFLTLIALSLFVLTNHAFERMNVRAHVLEDAAFSDMLTGVANRRGLERVLLRQAEAPAGSMALILLDMDNFKDVNDGHGHVFGDRVLQAVVQSLNDALRGSDVIGRWGGDEFLVLARDTSAEEARILADRLRRAVGNLAPEAGGGVTLSAGVTTWDGSGGLEEALRRVDRALYAAKHAGRDRTSLEQSAS